MIKDPKKTSGEYSQKESEQPPMAGSCKTDSAPTAIQEFIVPRIPVIVHGQSEFRTICRKTGKESDQLSKRLQQTAKSESRYKGFKKPTTTQLTGRPISTNNYTRS